MPQLPSRHRKTIDRQVRRRCVPSHTFDIVCLVEYYDALVGVQLYVKSLSNRRVHEVVIWRKESARFDEEL